MCLEIGPGQECVRDCCSVYLPSLGDTSDTDISQQPPCSPEPLPLFREPIDYTHTHTYTHYCSVYPSLGQATGSVLASADQDCQNHMTPAGLLRLGLCSKQTLLLAKTAHVRSASPAQQFHHQGLASIRGSKCFPLRTPPPPSQPPTPSTPTHSGRPSVPVSAPPPWKMASNQRTDTQAGQDTLGSGESSHPLPAAR